MNLKGKKALITGASGGFGADFSDILGSMGADLIIVARSKDKLEAVKKNVEEKHGVKIKIIVMDLTGFNAAQELYRLTENENIDILLNNAGYGMYNFFCEQKTEEIDNMLQLNMISLTALTNLFLKDMVRKNSGYIMNVSSFAGFNPTPFYAAYGASKAYVMNFTVALNTELRKSGSSVKVSAFCPGYTETGFVSRAGQKRSKFVESTIGKSYPAALEAIEGLLKGKEIVMPRFINKFGAFILKFMSRSKAAEMVFGSIKKK